MIRIRKKYQTEIEEGTFLLKKFQQPLCEYFSLPFAAADPVIQKYIQKSDLKLAIKCD